MFKIFKSNQGTTPVIKEVKAAEGTYKVGDALSLDANGRVAKASGTTKPTFISAGQGTLADDDALAVNPIYDGMEFATTFSANGSSLKKGNKVTIATNGAEVTATTTSGVAEIVEILGGGAVGTEVIVKF